MLMVQAINLASAAISFALPLADNSGNSFQKANEGPPTDPKVFEEQQKKLQEDSQRHKLSGWCFSGHDGGGNAARGVLFRIAATMDIVTAAMHLAAKYVVEADAFLLCFRRQ